MELIQMALAAVILGILYRRMILREKPEPVGKLQAILPVILGVISLPLSFLFFLGNGVVLLALGFDAGQLPMVLRSVWSAFFSAGLPEETAKLLMMLAAFLLFRKKLKNVYEYVLIGAGVGFGFTLLEEFAYGGVSMAAFRLLTLACHVCLGIQTAKQLGLARYRRLQGETKLFGEYARAFLLPVLIHTLYDACTATNRLLDSEDETIKLIGIALGLLAVAVYLFWQVRMLSALKKDTEKYCAMELLPQETGEVKEP